VQPQGQGGQPLGAWGRPPIAAFRAGPMSLPPTRKTTKARPTGPASMSRSSRKTGDGGASPYMDTDELDGLSDDDDYDDERWEQVGKGGAWARPLTT
jgi:hypothetical protein